VTDGTVDAGVVPATAGAAVGVDVATAAGAAPRGLAALHALTASAHPTVAATQASRDPRALRAMASLSSA